MADKVGRLLHDLERLSMKLLLRRHPEIGPAVKLLQGMRHEFVEREVEKDRLMIERAGRAFERGAEPSEADVEAVFEETREADREFLERLSRVPFSEKFSYAEIKPVRTERIRLIGGAVRALLGSWGEGMTFEQAARGAYGKDEFRGMVRGVLELYNRETEVFSRTAVRLPPVVSLAAEAFSRSLRAAMDEAAGRLAEECTEKVFGAP
jgi:hypothetical protein